jgi:S-adenosylmethionine uptake transporter
MAPPAEIAFFQSLFTALFLSLAALVVGFPAMPAGPVWVDISAAAALSFVSLLAVMGVGAGAGASIAAHQIFGLSHGPH